MAKECEADGEIGQVSYRFEYGVVEVDESLPRLIHGPILAPHCTRQHSGEQRILLLHVLLVCSLGEGGGMRQGRGKREDEGGGEEGGGKGPRTEVCLSDGREGHEVDAVLHKQDKTQGTQRGREGVRGLWKTVRGQRSLSACYSFLCSSLMPVPYDCLRLILYINYIFLCTSVSISVYR